MITLGWPLLLCLIPLPWLLRRISGKASTTNNSLTIPFFSRIEALGITQAPINVGAKFQFLPSVIWLLLVIALARPQLIDDWQSSPISGRDLVIAVDISASMNFPDLGLNNQSRLDVVKGIGGKFIERRQGDRLSLVLFGSQAYWQTPLTFDYLAVKHLLNEAEIGFAGRETALGDTIGLVIKRLSDPSQQKILILITDGANNSGEIDPIEAAQMAAQAKLKIYTVGIGADSMQAQTAQGISEINPSINLDQQLLTKIAQITGGSYFRAKGEAQLIALYQQIERLEPSVRSDNNYRLRSELYHWPLALALLISAYIAVMRTIDD